MHSKRRQSQEQKSGEVPQKKLKSQSSMEQESTTENAADEAQELLLQNIEPATESAADLDTSALREKLSSFKNIDEKSPSSTGTFVVINAVFYNPGEKPGFFNDLCELIAMEKEESMLKIVAYGGAANKCRNLKLGDVIHLDKFGCKHDDYAHFFLSKCAFDLVIDEKTVLTVIQTESALWKHHFELMKSNVMSSSWLVKYGGYIATLRLDHIVFPKEVTCRDHHKTYVASYMFMTSDAESVQISFYDHQLDKLAALEKNEVYEIENCHLKEKQTSEFAKFQFAEPKKIFLKKMSDDDQMEHLYDMVVLSEINVDRDPYRIYGMKLHILEKFTNKPNVCAVHNTHTGESTPSTRTKRVRSLRKRRSEVEVDQEREERRQANAQKKREYQARQRATETEEQRRTRLDKDRDRHRQMRAEKKKTAFHIQEPEHLPDVFYLGKRDKRCTFCGALHFVGFHNCCREGRIFINPMKKLWEPLQSLYFNEDHPNRGEFLNKILQYNTLLSMASSQHDRVLQNPFGVQSVKVRGSVHHMPSTLYPENLSHPRYGNVYIYDVNRATEYRMNEIIARDINEDILKELGQQVALCNPYANIPYISCSDEMNYVDRMVQVKDALLQQGIEIDWTIEVEEMELIPRGIAREIAEIESLMHVDDGGSDESDEEDYQVQQIAYHSDSDEDPDEDEHEIRDEHRNDAVNNEELQFVERNGELYPHRDTVPVVEHEQRLLADYVDDSGRGGIIRRESG
ncbi:hypothetical protein QR680_004685 [Steinernema hermaphroditum]|uniref:Uncharacterized protein n=1 Tax=Steinernema hermaphroditum TaxID=289476 RepID=A0AA39HQJ4_9BILA|nr:hypothetical protein QR680_004685 [Steinernema hermaphroditum]